MRYRLIPLTLLLSLAVALFVGGCSADSGRHTSDAPGRVDIGDSGRGTSVADEVYRTLGSVDGGWVPVSSDYDPTAELDTAVRGAAAKVTGHTAAFEKVDGSRVRDGDAVIQRWDFSDGSELTYRTTVDAQNHRSRVASVRVKRP